MVISFIYYFLNSIILTLNSVTLKTHTCIFSPPHRNKNLLTEASKKVFSELLLPAPHTLSKCHRYAEHNKCDDVCRRKQRTKTRTCGDSSSDCK